MSPQTTVSTQEALRILSVSRKTLYALMERGRLTPLPRTLRGQALHFDREAVEHLRDVLLQEANAPGKPS
ncbi:MAG: helix-turn-helix domain-containing protein [Ktedonobacterales bacterium]|nr:helix-turn-helix domain-containing protein [Ktedonobacterales bacterium]